MFDRQVRAFRFSSPALSQFQSLKIKISVKFYETLCDGVLSSNVACLRSTASYGEPYFVRQT